MDMFLKRRFLNCFRYSPIEFSWLGVSAIMLYIAAKYAGIYFLLFVAVYIIGLYFLDKWSYSEEGEQK